MNDPQPIDPRRRIRELLAIPDRDRTDAEWDELNELEIRTAPGNREVPERGQDKRFSQPSQGYPKRQDRKPDRKNSGGGNSNGGNNTRPEARAQESRQETKPQEGRSQEGRNEGRTPRRQHRRPKRSQGGNSGNGGAASNNGTSDSGSGSAGGGAGSTSSD